jgi:hypothetical protein
MDQLHQLHQVNSVNNYIDVFENWMTAMKHGRSYLPAEFFVERFISGLKESINHHVFCQKPSTLLSAYLYTREYEKSFLVTARRPQQVAHYQCPANAPQAGRMPMDREAKPAHAANRPRVPRKCWYCPDNYTPGHRSPAMQQVLNALEMQDDSEDELEDANAMIAAVETNIVQTPGNAEPSTQDKAMLISAAA